jgi:hypothetical protein
MTKAKALVGMAVASALSAYGALAHAHGMSSASARDDGYANGAFEVATPFSPNESGTVEMLDEMHQAAIPADAIQHDRMARNDVADTTVHSHHGMHHRMFQREAAASVAPRDTAHYDLARNGVTSASPATLEGSRVRADIADHDILTPFSPNESGDAYTDLQLRGQPLAPLRVSSSMPNPVTPWSPNESDPGQVAYDMREHADQVAQLDEARASGMSASSSIGSPSDSSIGLRSEAGVGAASGEPGTAVLEAQPEALSTGDRTAGLTADETIVVVPQGYSVIEVPDAQSSRSSLSQPESLDGVPGGANESAPPAE